MAVLGLDIGGANLKAADCLGNWAQRPFAIWKSPASLAAELRALIEPFSGIDHVAVTMTAELADCYRTKEEGVRQIVSAVQSVAGATLVSVWSTRGTLMASTAVQFNDLFLTASNWHALATWLAAKHFESQDALLIDIGTTTTDIIPLGQSRVYATGRTDFQRLVAGELVYTGIRRTPLCAVTQAVRLNEQSCPLAAELFATIQDVYLLLGDFPEDPHDCDTANGRAATRDEAWDRLVRQLCCDRTEISLPDAVKIAQDIARQQERQIGTALELALRSTPIGYDCQMVVVSGSGRFLAQRVIANNDALRSVKVLDISELLYPAVPEVACAYAVAQLASVPRHSVS
ncbi:MAG: Hydantoinase/oxoprolinase [Planctomycetaceae bacterium]|nr:Hydantoinase/oxoprolinase [Planctomycetaceae bacterium]